MQKFLRKNGMVKLSVLTPSNRTLEGLKVVEKALRRQTFSKDSYEWVIGSPQKPEGLTLPFIWVQDPKKEEDDYWVFNKLMNKMVREAQGELIVSIQDFTSFTPQALNKFWFHFINNPNSAVSGVGGKYSDDTFIEQVWKDPRERDDQGTLYETYFNNWEGNFGSIPKKAILDVGGFDEYLDKYAGMDWYSVNYRAEKLGYTYYMDQTNKSFSLEHGRYDYWEERNAINGPFQKRTKHYKDNNYVLGYN